MNINIDIHCILVKLYQLLEQVLVSTLTRMFVRPIARLSHRTVLGRPVSRQSRIITRMRRANETKLHTITTEMALLSAIQQSSPELSITLLLLLTALTFRLPKSLAFQQQTLPILVGARSTCLRQQYCFRLCRVSLPWRRLGT